jgi:hypothetical protein
MTGWGEPGFWWLGVKTFRKRQSSDILAWPKGDGGCGQCGANWVASRTPGQLAAGCGGRHRSAPTGGAAYGMPRNSSTAPLARIRRPGHQRTFDSLIRDYVRLGEMVQGLVTETQLPVALASFRSGDPVPFGDLLLGQDGLVYASAQHPRLLPLSALAGVSVSRYAVKVHQVGRNLPWLTAERTAVPNAAILAGLAERIVAGRDLRDSDEAESSRAPGMQ